MEAQPSVSVSALYDRYRKSVLFTLFIFLFCFPTELAFSNNIDLKQSEVQSKEKKSKKEADKKKKKDDKKDKKKKDKDKKDKKDKHPKDKVTICHKGKTKEIHKHQLQAHLNHGDYEGACGAPVYTGDIIPYLPPIGKVDNSIGNALTSLAELYESTGSAPSDEVFMVTNGSSVLVKIETQGGPNGKAEVLAKLQNEYNINTHIESEINPWEITVSFPIGKINDLMDLDLWDGKVKFSDKISPPIFNSGVAITAGDFAQTSDIARNAYGVDGQNIKVCAMSDSYNALGLNAASDNIATNDLPDDVQVVLDYKKLDGLLSDVNDEGRALLQIIHDIAPGADLAFRTGAYGEQDMANGIFALRDEGCHIILDDITYPKEPFYRDGILAQAVNTVVEQGILFFTSAGNFGDNSYQSQFNPASNSPANHAFDGNNDIFQEIAFSEGYYRLILQWDDNYESLDTAEIGAVNDLDIYLLNDAGDTIVNSNENNIGKDPIEEMNFYIANGSAKSKIVIHMASEPNPVHFKYIVFKSYGFDTDENVTRSSTIAGHANANGAITVGAMPYWKSPAYDSIPVNAIYSSHGGTSVSGQPPRQKPDITAPDGVNTTVHLDGGDIDNDNIPNFFGTSASTPHAAGMAALLLSAQTKFEVSFDVKTKMKETAYNMGTNGYDVESGMGLIQGDAAMKTFASPMPTLTELLVPNNVFPGTEPFDVTIKGMEISDSVQVFMGEVSLATHSVSNSQIVASVPLFNEGEDPPIIAYNPPKEGTNGTDGGYSEPLFFFTAPKKKVIVKANDATKRYGERLPEFSVTILVDSIPLDESGLTLDSLGLTDLTISTTATSSSNLGINNIVPSDSTLLQSYDYTFKPGILRTEKLAVEIIPNDLTKTYGDKIDGISYRYNFDSTNIDPETIPSFIDALEQDYKSTFTHEDSLAIVNRARFLANRARFLANTAWMATDLGLRNRARFLANGNVMIEIDTTMLQEYQEFPEGPPTNRARFLANGQLLADEKVYNANRARFLANDNALVTNDDSTNVFSDMVVIVDSADYAISKIYSINLITGLDVTGDSLHYIVPGAFLSPKAANLEITYGMGNLTITPATLNVAVDDKLIALGDSLPEFSSTITGYKYEDSDSSVFSSITYESIAYDEVGDFAINPSLEFKDWINYTLDIVPGILTIDFAINGRIAIAPFNSNGDTDLVMVDSDGTDSLTLLDGPDFVREPEFSPDGTEIVYTFSDNLYGTNSNIRKVRSDGSTPPFQLTSDDQSSQPTYSPDGAKIAFTSGGQIMIMDADGLSAPVQVTNTPKNKYSLVFSADGEAIFFTQLKDESSFNTVYKLTLNTSETDALTTEDIYFRDLDVFPDGSKILFARAPSSGASGNAIMSMNPDGSDLNIIHEPLGGISIGDPVYSPNGKEIAFIMNGTGLSLFTMHVDGTDIRQIFTMEDNVLSPSWGTYPDYPFVAIPDSNFEQALIDLGIDSDGIINQKILRSDAQAVTFLDVSDPENNENLPNVPAKITDLTGIEAFINMTDLICRQNQLTNLDLSNNGALENLRCNSNQLSNLDVTQNTSLLSLRCHSNALTDLDVTQNTNLTYLVFGDNQLKNIDVSQNTVLQYLRVYRNQLTELDISNNTELIYLSCDGNQLVHLDASQNPLLWSIRCWDNQLENINVSQNPGLRRLECYNNKLTSLDLRQAPVLNEFNCTSNELTSLDVRNGNNANFIVFEATDNKLNCISVDDETADHSSWNVDFGVGFSNDCSLPILVSIPDPNFEQALIDLGIDSDGVVNQQLSKYDALVVSELDIYDPENNENLPNVHAKIADLTGIEAFTNLVRLQCHQNQLTSLDVTQNTKLEELQCGDNLLTELDVSQNTALTVLGCWVNQLTSLDISQNTALTSLSFQANQLTSIDVSQHPALLELNCEANQLTSLDVSHNPLLTSLGSGNNPLSSLDISQNTALESLRCYANGLSALDVSLHSALRELLCNDNELTELDVSQNTALIDLDCKNNQLTSLDVSQNNDLITFACRFNQLSEIDVTQNTALTVFSCSDNMISELDVSQNTALTNLYCVVNQLTSLDVSQNTQLSLLYCRENLLTELDLSQNTLLTRLLCHTNKLTSLDLSQNTMLYDVWCYNNQLTSLDVRNGNNANFTNFNANDNKLNCINVDDESADHSSWFVDYGVSFSNDCGVPVLVSIPDPNFEQALIDLGIDSDGVINQQISKYDVLVVTELDVSDPENNENLPNVHSKIADLTGIEAFTNLTYLNCEVNALANLDVTQNKQLTTLRCDVNQLTELDVSQNSALEFLECQGNQLSNLDLSQNVALTQLWCSNNKLEYLNISQNTALLELGCDSNQLAQLDVTNNTALTILYCNDNQLINLDVTQNKALLGFECNINQLEELNTSQNTDLVWLFCAINQLKDLDVTQNIALSNVSCSENQLTSLDVSQNTSLTIVSCFENQLTSLDVRNGNNVNFTQFDAAGNNLSCISVDDETADHSTWLVDYGMSFSNDCDVPVYVSIQDANFEQALIDLGIDTDGVVNQQISKYDALVVADLDVSDPENNEHLPNVHAKISDLTGIEAFANLTRLHCQNNLITNLDLTPHTALNDLDCSNNQLTGLDISQNTLLIGLECSSNDLTALDVTLNSELNWLSCSNNQLTSLDVTQNIALTWLSCSENQLSALDVSQNTSLSGISCQSNEFTSLDVSQNTLLENLNCNNNQLTLLDVGNNPLLVELNCGANSITNLDVSVNTALVVLDFRVNALSSIDVSTNILLEILEANDNPLGEVNVSNNPALRVLGCSNNLLTAIDVSNNPAIEILWCPYNAITSVDVRTNTALIGLFCQSNSLVSLDVRNGVNSSMWFDATDNPDLNCINVSDVDYATNNWINIDFGVSFSNDCDVPVLVSIPDPNFEQALIDLGIDSDGNINQQISKYDVLVVSELDVSDPENNEHLPNVHAKISDLTGIEAFANLTGLHCQNNLITNLDLTPHTALNDLDCSNNQLTELDIAQNSLLIGLECSSNELTALDVTLNSALNWLSCSNNQLTSLDVSQNNALTWLSCAENQLSALDVSQNTSLSGISCQSNELTSLDVTQNTLLENLDCGANQLTSLSLTQNPNLVWLNCGANQLQALDLSNNTALSELNCYENQLTGLDVSKNTALTAIHCWDNQLTELDVSKNTSLATLNSWINQIAELNVSENTVLSQLHFAGNLLTSLDLSQNTALTELACDSNQLTELDLRNGNNENLNYFNAYDNKLICISVDDENADHSSWDVDFGVSFSNDCGVPVYVSIHDPNFEQALIDLNIDSDGIINQQISKYDALVVSYLNVTDPENNEQLPNVHAKIADLTGIEAFVNLTSLNCEANLLTNLDVTHQPLLNDLNCNDNLITSLDVSQNSALTWLYCPNNQLSDLDVTQNTALSELHCWSNQITSLDVSENTVLIELHCWDNQLTELDVSGTTALTTLNGWNNQIAELDVSRNTVLSKLHFGSNLLTILDLSQNTALTELACDSNQLTELNLRNGNNENMTYFNAHNNPLNCISVDDENADHSGWGFDFGVSFSNDCSIPVLVSIPDPNFEQALIDLGIDSDGTINQQMSYYDAQVVTGFDVSDPENNESLPNVHAKISDLTGIEAFVNLTFLNCERNLLANLDVTQNIDLDWLSFSENQLTSLDVSQNTNLTFLHCVLNQLTSLDVTQNTQLNSLSCADNQLTSLDVSQNSSLELLHGWNNKFTELDFSINTALKELICWGNQLTSLDVSQNTLLENLDCGANQLTSLSLTQNPNLVWLNCGANQLEVLDLSNNTALSELHCSENQLTGLDISENIVLTELHCWDNQLTELDVSRNTALTTLNGWNNQIAELDASINTVLSKLHFGSNLLTILDLSQNTVLTELACDSNLLTELDLRNGNNENITYFNAHNNPLNCISVDDENADHSSWEVDFGVSFSNDCGVPVYVTIPDPNFEQALIDLNIDSDGIINQQISKYDALVITELDVSDPVNNPNLPNVNDSISDLTGIEAFTNLIRLQCHQNQLTSLDVTQNTELIELNYGFNQLSEIDVTQNTALVSLSCNWNQISSLDVSQNTLLGFLDCGANQLTDLDVSQNLALDNITCYENQLTSLDVSQNRSLTSLSCDINQITSLDITQNPALTYLYCASNLLTRLDARNGNNANFNTFVAHDNKLTCINVDDETVDHSTWQVDLGVSFSNDCGVPVFVSIPDPNFEQALIDLGIDSDGTINQQISKYDALVVTSLDVSDPENNPNLPNVNTKISALTGIEAFVNLNSLHCHNNLITNLNVTQNKALTYIDCSFNQLTDLDVAQNTALTSLICYDNQLISLDVTRNIALIGLECGSNKLTELDVSKNTTLTYLSCYENQLTSLDLSQNTALYSLSFQMNQIGNIDVSAHGALTELNCESNQLTNLDVSNNPLLTSLGSGNNPLSSLDINHNTALEMLRCYGNGLSELDVSQHTALRVLLCDDNQLTELNVSQNIALNNLDCQSNRLTSLDVSNNTALTELICWGNQLNSLDVRNGNNANFISFTAYNNDLSCISVDDENADHSDWYVDYGVSFSNDCDVPVFVNIPDPNFEQALIDLGIDSDGTVNQQLSQFDALSVTNLDVSDADNNPDLPNVDAKITDLTGIEAFINITGLDCHENELSSLNVSKNTGLTSLNCFNNQITSLEVTNNIALVSLLCLGNQIPELDVSQNTALSRLTCYDNLLTSLDVSNNISLTSLICSDNQILELDVSQNTLLDELWCDNNLLTDLNLSGNTALTNLLCGFNNLTSLDVSQNTALEFFGCTNSQLTSLDVSNNTALTDLDCGWNQMSELDLTRNTALQVLWCANNQLTSLDVRNGNNANFTTFEAQYNNLSCINVDDETAEHSSWNVDNGVIFSNNCTPSGYVYIPDPNFEQALIDLGIDSDGIINQQILKSDAETSDSLYLSGYGITGLTGIEAFINLNMLDCSNNLLTSIDLTDNIALTHVLCSSNRLENLNLSANTGLTYLHCESNQLINLNVSNNTELYYLNCMNNQLISLDVLHNTALAYLTCSHNQLTNLDVSQNTDLIFLSCDDNQLTELDLSNNSALTEFYCWFNPLTELDVRNGNNANFTQFGASDTDLSCISVDDEGADHSSWLVNTSVVFSNDCSISHTGTRTISGSVNSSQNGSSIPGANIIIKGTTFGVVADINGNYSISVEGDNQILIFSYLGFITIEEPTGNRSVVNISLDPALAGFASTSMESSSIVQGDITIYPNPVINVITIDHQDESVLISDMEVVVYDNWGILYPLHTTIIESKNGFELDLSSLIPKSYILHISDGKTLEVFRIQKN